MKYRRFGQTDLYVSELCLGTMTFAGQGDMWSKIGTVGQAGAIRLLERALSAGICFIDTADDYSEGLSELFLGLRCVIWMCHAKTSSSRPRSGAASESVNAIGLSCGHVLDGVSASLKRLGFEYIALYIRYTASRGETYGVDTYLRSDHFQAPHAGRNAVGGATGCPAASKPRTRGETPGCGCGFFPPSSKPRTRGET